MWSSYTMKSGRVLLYQVEVRMGRWLSYGATYKSSRSLYINESPKFCHVPWLAQIKCVERSNRHVAAILGVGSTVVSGGIWWWSFLKSDGSLDIYVFREWIQPLWANEAVMNNIWRIAVHEFALSTAAALLEAT